MNPIKDLINAYKFAFCDPSKILPMPFEDYNGDGDIGATILYQDRTKFYTLISDEKRTKTTKTPRKHFSNIFIKKN